MPDKILFVDDDRYFARLYKENLEKVFDVTCCYEALAAVEFLRSNVDLAAVVIDMMMPPPIGHEAECQEGNTTGLWILKETCDVITKRQIIVLVLSNLRVKYVSDELRFLGFPPETIEVMSKVKMPADELSEKVMAMVRRHGRGTND